MENKKREIAKFYRQILSDPKLKERIEEKAKKIANEEDFKNLIQQEIVPLMKKYDVNFSEQELLEYEKEMLKELSDKDLANVSGGVSIKSALLTGGLLSMALLGGVGLNASAMDDKEPPSPPGQEQKAKSSNNGKSRSTQNSNLQQFNSIISPLKKNLDEPQQMALDKAMSEHGHVGTDGKNIFIYKETARPNAVILSSILTPNNDTVLEIPESIVTPRGKVNAVGLGEWFLSESENLGANVSKFKKLTLNPNISKFAFGRFSAAGENSGANIEEVNFGNSKQIEIGKNAFSYLQSLKSATFSNDVEQTILRDYAFFNSPNFETVNLPAHCNYMIIESDIFGDSKIKEINIEAEELKVEGLDVPYNYKGAHYSAYKSFDNTKTLKDNNYDDISSDSNNNGNAHIDDIDNKNNDNIENDNNDNASDNNNNNANEQQDVIKKAVNQQLKSSEGQKLISESKMNKYMQEKNANGLAVAVGGEGVFNYVSDASGVVLTDCYTKVGDKLKIPKEVITQDGKKLPVVGIGSNNSDIGGEGFQTTEFEKIELPSTEKFKIQIAAFRGNKNIKEVDCSGVTELLEIGDGAFENSSLERFISPTQKVKIITREDAYKGSPIEKYKSFATHQQESKSFFGSFFKKASNTIIDTAKYVLNKTKSIINLACIGTKSRNAFGTDLNSVAQSIESGELNSLEQSDLELLLNADRLMKEGDRDSQINIAPNDDGGDDNSDSGKPNDDDNNNNYDKHNDNNNNNDNDNNNSNDYGQNYNGNNQESDETFTTNENNEETTQQNEDNVDDNLAPAETALQNDDDTGDNSSVKSKDEEKADVVQDAEPEQKSQEEAQPEVNDDDNSASSKQNDNDDDNDDEDDDDSSNKSAISKKLASKRHKNIGQAARRNKYKNKKKKTNQNKNIKGKNTDVVLNNTDDADNNTQAPEAVAVSAKENNNDNNHPEPEATAAAATAEENYADDDSDFNKKSDSLAIVTVNNNDKAAQPKETKETTKSSETKTENSIRYEINGSILKVLGSGPIEDYGYGNFPWSKDQNNIEEIILSEGITSIPDLAFYSFEGLVKVTLPKSLESIGQEAFCRCSKLTDINFPQGLKSIGQQAFSECESLTKVNLPGSLESTGNCTFENCTSLTNVSFSEGLKNVGTAMFRGCIALTKVTLPKSLEVIGSSAFENCKALTEITLPENLKKIEPYAFIACEKLTNINIPDSVSSLGESAFSNCKSLTKISISASITSFGSHPFDLCPALTEVTINSDAAVDKFKTIFNGNVREHITKIILGKDVTKSDIKIFKGLCPKLTEFTPVSSTLDSASSGYDELTQTLTFNSDEEIDDFFNVPKKDNDDDNNTRDPNNQKFLNAKKIVLGENVESIDADRLSKFPNLETIEVDENNPNYKSIDGVLYTKNGKTLVYRPSNKKDNKLNIFYIPQGVTSIADKAFYGSKNLYSVLIPPSVTHIGAYAFAESSIQSVSIPSGVKVIEDGTFKGCKVLTHIHFSNGLKVIGKFAFAHCLNLQPDKFSLPKSLKAIGNGAFNDCNTGIQNNLPNLPTTYDEDDDEDTVNSLEDNKATNSKQAFDTNVEKNNISGTDIYWQFDENTGTLIFSGSGTLSAGKVIQYNNIHTRPWEHSDKVKKIIIQEGITGIIDGYGSAGLFYGLDNLEEAEISGSVKIIGNQAFAGCEKLKTVKLGNGVTKIKTAAFSGCEDLKSINLPPSVEEIGALAFSKCLCLESVEIPSSVKTIETNTFKQCSSLSYVTFSDGNNSQLKIIPEGAFNECPALSAVVPPFSATIEEGAFDKGCRYK